MNPIENFLWGILKQQLQNRQFFGNLRTKVYEILNETDADVVRKMYKNYANRLLDF